MYSHLYGMVCAAITPYDETGKPSEKDVRALCSYLIENGVHSLYPNGTNGESLLLSKDERKQTAEWYADENKGRAVLSIQCGAMTTEETYSLIRHAKALGCDSAGVMTPPFWPMDEKALEQYYGDILPELGSFPVYIYNIPGRTGNDVSPALLGRLADRSANIYGIKCSMPDLIRINEYLRCAGRELDVLIGNDTLALSCLCLGGKGFVTGPGAVFPRLYAGLYNAFAEGDIEKAQRLQQAIIGVLYPIRDIPEIPAIKYMLTKMGVIHNEMCRRPLRALTDSEKRRLDQALRAAGGR